MNDTHSVSSNSSTKLSEEMTSTKPFEYNSTKEVRTPPIKKQKVSHGRTFTPLDRQILTRYKMLVPKFCADMAPDALLETVKKIIEAGNVTLLERMQKDDFDLSLLDRALHQGEGDIFAATPYTGVFSTPLVDTILRNYHRVQVSMEKDWLPPYFCMAAIQKALKKNSHDSENNQTLTKGVIVPYPTPGSLVPKEVVASVLPGNPQKVYLLEMTSLIGEGTYGQVFEAISHFKTSKVVKIAKEKFTSSLLAEWSLLWFIHEEKEVLGIQSKPKALTLVKQNNVERLIMVGNRYDDSLSDILHRNPSFFRSALDLLKAFQPLFEGLIYCTYERKLIHRDIKMNNLFVLNNNIDGLRLDLSDWGMGCHLPVETEQDEEACSRLEQMLTKWIDEKGSSCLATLKPIKIQGSAEQVLGCLHHIYRSRDVLGLGRVLYKTLGITFGTNGKLGEDLVMMKGLRDKFIPVETINKIFDLIVGMCNDDYAPSRIAGISLPFPNRLTMIESLEMLNNILFLLEKNS